VFPASTLIIPPWLVGPYPWAVNLYEPPSTPADVKLWSDVQLHSVVAVWPVARAILPNGHRTGRLYRAGPYVLALNGSLVPELGFALQRGEWVRLDNGALGRNLLELYAYVHWRRYRDAVIAIGQWPASLGPTARSVGSAARGTGFRKPTRCMQMAQLSFWTRHIRPAASCCPT